MFRLFLSFPLIALVLPDIAFTLDDVKYQIPVWHFVVATVLTAAILASYVLTSNRQGLLKAMGGRNVAKNSGQRL